MDDDDLIRFTQMRICVSNNKILVIKKFPIKNLSGLGRKEWIYALKSAVQEM